jgi:hypothetical protein
MQPVRIDRPLVVAVAMAALLLLPALAQASNGLATISGNVRDSGGSPVIGALVVILPANPIMSERMAWTDKRGFFIIPNLFAGQYSVKISMSRFLPALKNGIQLNSGGNTMLTVNLQNALDVVRRAVTRSKNESDDMLWTMRSSRSTQPPLQLREGEKKEKTNPTPADYSGYFQVYSKSVETSSGVEEGVGSQFSVTMPLDAKSKVTLAGQYSEVPTQPRGFGASYEFRPADRHHSAIGVNVRQGSLIGDPLNSDLREIQLQYSEEIQWSDHLVIDYGAEVGRADARADRNYLRPRFAVSWVPEARSTLTITATSQAPAAADDPVRGKDYFDRAAYIPPTLERYAHTEIIASRILGDGTEVSAAAFRDRTDTQALFVSKPDGRQGVLILDSRHSPSQGLRLHINQEFHGFEAGLGYTTTTGLALRENSTSTVGDIHRDVRRERFHLVMARFKAEIDSTQTEFTAVYRWMSNFSATRLDPYQRTVEYNDPSLSLSLAQNLPNWRMLPGKMQAIIDARNLFEQAYSSKNLQLAQYPRLVKGGINIKF